MTLKPKKPTHPVDDLIHYSEFPGFQHYFLEDSWICGIVGRPGLLELHITAVINPGHPEYQPAKPDEMYPYRSAVLRFNGIKAQEWYDGDKPVPGPTLGLTRFESDGDLDLGGNIYLHRNNAGQYLLDCDLGFAKITASEPPVIELVDV